MAVLESRVILGMVRPSGLPCQLKHLPRGTWHPRGMPLQCTNRRQPNEKPIKFRRGEGGEERLPTSSALAPTDHPACCLASRLRLMPIWVPPRAPLPTEHVILSAAKDLCPRRVRPFAALRVTIDGRPPKAVALENLLKLTRSEERRVGK